MTHKLKFKGKSLCDDVYNGVKTFEVRFNDRDYHVGDLIVPIAIDEDLNPIDHPINDVVYRIVYMIDNWVGLKDGYCILGIVPV